MVTNVSQLRDYLLLTSTIFFSFRKEKNAEENKVPRKNWTEHANDPAKRNSVKVRKTHLSDDDKIKKKEDNATKRINNAFAAVSGGTFVGYLWTLIVLG